MAWPSVAHRRKLRALEFRRCHIEQLETRTLLAADVRITNATIIDGNNRETTSLPVGEMVGVRVNWTIANAPASTSYVVRFSMGGMSFDSPPQTSVAGSNTGTLSLAVGLFTTSGNNTILVMVDPTNALGDPVFIDNFTVVSFAGVAPSTLPSKFVTPIVGTQSLDWTVVNYVDTNPQFGPIGDFHPGPHAFTYDGHDAIDITVPTFQKQDAGVQVLAAAAGLVTGVIDGFFDRNTMLGPAQANLVAIDHGNGWRTEYLHFATNTITVRPGDLVVAGHVLGLVGSSGNSSDAHLHFTVFHNNRVVETSYAPHSYFFQPLEYQGTAAMQVMDSGVTTYDPTNDTIAKERPVEAGLIPTSYNGPIYFWFAPSHLLPGDSYTVDWIQPNGVTAHSETSTHQTTAGRAGYQRRSYTASTWTSGTWRINVVQGGAVVATKTFQVTTGMGTAAAYVSEGTTYIPNGRTTPVAFATTPQGTPVQLAFTIANRGFAPLVVSNIQLPPGFSIVPGQSMVIAPGASRNLAVRINAALVGTHFGQIRLTTNDPQAPFYSFNVQGVVTGTAEAGAPQIERVDVALAYMALGGPQKLLREATLSDSDSAHFGGGTLTVAFASGGTISDRLGILNRGNSPGQINVNGSTVSYGPIPIGTVSGGSLNQPLVVKFNSFATIPAVEALLNSLSFTNSLSAPGSAARYVRVTLVDDQGKTSNQPIQVVVIATGPYHLVVDMAHQGYRDGSPDEIAAHVVRGRFELWVNGSVLFATAATNLTGLTIRGSSDDETVRIDGTVTIPVELRFERRVTLPRKGDDALILDDSSRAVNLLSSYVVTDETLSRTGWFLPGVTPPETVQINYLGFNRVDIRTSPRSNNVSIPSTAAGAPLTIQANGTTSITVGNGTLSEIRSEVFVDGTAGTTSLILDDQEISGAFLYDTAYTITADTIRRVLTATELPVTTNTATVLYRGVRQIEIKGGNVRNTFHVQSLYNTALTLRGNSRQDLFRLGNGLLDSVDARVVIVGGEGPFTDVLTLDDTDEADTATRSSDPVYTITRNFITRLNTTLDTSPNSPIQIANSYSLTVGYSGIEKLELLAGSGGSSVTVLSSNAATETILVGGEGADRFTLGGPSTSLHALEGPVRVNGGSGSDLLTVDDRGSLLDFVALKRHTFTLFDQTVHWNSFIVANIGQLNTDRRFDHDGIEQVLIWGNSAASTFIVESTAEGTATEIRAGAGADTVQVGDQLGRLKGTLLLNGGSGSDSLVFSDRGNSAHEVYGLYADRFERLGPPDANGDRLFNMAPVRYEMIESIAIYTTPGGSSTSVVGTPAGSTTTVFGSPGAQDVFWINPDLGPVLGRVHFVGQAADGDRATYEDIRSPGGQVYTVAADPANPNLRYIARTGVPLVSFSGLDQIGLVTSRLAGNLVNVLSVPAGVQLGVSAGDGDRIFLGMPTASGRVMNGIRGTVIVSGLSTPNAEVALVIDDSGNTDLTPRTIALNPPETSQSSGSSDVIGMPARVVWRLTPISTVHIRGGAADETFEIGQGTFLGQVAIDGGGGANAISYATWTQDVTVDLASGVATAITGGIVNFRHIYGGAGSDILIGNDQDNIILGGAGNDTIDGRLGRDLLVGGSGADRIIGTDGREDIVVAGRFTYYDEANRKVNRAAVDAILGEWTRSVPRSERIDRLRGALPVGPDGALFPFLLNNANVFDDDALDSLAIDLTLDWLIDG